MVNIFLYNRETDEDREGKRERNKKKKTRDAKHVANFLDENVPKDRFHFAATDYMHYARTD